jgi:hypothetical protein
VAPWRRTRKQRQPPISSRSRADGGHPPGGGPTTRPLLPNDFARGGREGAPWPCIFGLLAGEEAARGRRGEDPMEDDAPPRRRRRSPLMLWMRHRRIRSARAGRGPVDAPLPRRIRLEQRWRGEKEGGDAEGDAGARLEGASSSSWIPGRRGAPAEKGRGEGGGRRGRMPPRLARVGFREREGGKGAGGRGRWGRKRGGEYDEWVPRVGSLDEGKK